MENNKNILCEEENIIIYKCDFCELITKTYYFDNSNNITKEEMIENDIDPHLYDLHFNNKICSVCREKKLHMPYTEM